MPDAATLPWAPPETDKAATPSWTPPSSDKVTAPAPNPDDNIVYSMLGKSQGTINKEATAREADTARQKADFSKANAQPGVPLDTENSLPLALRARASLESNPKILADLVSKQPGVLASRLSKDGSNVIATVDDGRGGKKDMLLNPINEAPGLGSLAGEAYPIAKTGALAGLAYGTGGLSLVPQALALGGGAAAMETAKRVGSRLFAGQDVQPAEVAGGAAKEAAINAAAPLVLGAGAKGLGIARNFLASGAGPVNTAAEQAAGRLGVENLPSMVTNSKLLARMEAGAGLKPQNEALTKGLTDAEARQVTLNGAQGPLQPNALAQVPSEQQVAGAVQPIAAANEAKAAGRVADANAAAATEAQGAVKTTLDTGLGAAKPTQSEAGAYLRGKLESFAQNVKNEADKNYPALFKAAEDKGVTLDPKPLSDVVARISEEDPHGAAQMLSPSIKQIQGLEGKLNPLASAGEDTGILDALGKPVLARAEPPPPIGLQEAIRVRTILRNRLNSPTDPLGDSTKHYLNEGVKSIDSMIDTAIDSDKSGELRKLYDTAKGSYSEGAQALEQGRLPKTFNQAGDAGYVPDDKLVPSLVAGQGNLDGLQAWKSVLTPGDYALLKRQGVQHLIDSSQGPGGFIDAQKFLSKVNGLTPEMQTELLGPLQKPLTENTQLLAAARGAKIDSADLEAALKTPGQAPKLLQDAFAKSAAYDKQYNNKIAIALRGGNLGPNELGNVDQFTSTWLNGAGKSDVQQAMMQIRAASPETAEMVRQRALKNILDDSRAANTSTQAAGETNPLVDSKKLSEYIAPGPTREKYQAVIGKDGMQFLEDLANVSKARENSVIMGSGNPLTMEGDAERLGAIVGGNHLALAREAGRGALNTALAIPGKTLANPAVSKFLITGELPSLGSNAKAALFAAPGVANTALSQRN